jgi:hypothetical protein
MSKADSNEAITVTAPYPAPGPVKPRRDLLEILLRPRNIQWLLGLGGALMVIGLIILLWVNEFFTAPIMAVSLGIANTALLLSGFWVIRWTRHSLAGKALTLLACLIMPLNLWYYHSNGLITVDGHLWVAALFISALYAVSARFLRDEVFVYIFAAGVTLTGLLMLADLPPSPQRFWEIAMPATLLVILGVGFIHTERAFPEQEGPFSRARFGRAFFWSGHALLGAGLLLVLGADIAGQWLYEPYFRPLYERLQAQPSPIVNELRLLALALVLAGTYAYIYSDVVVRRVGAYFYLATLTLLWAQVLILEQLQLEMGISIWITVLAGTALVVHAVKAVVLPETRYARFFPLFGVVLSMAAVLVGLMTIVRAISTDLRGVWQAEAPSWHFIGAMALAAVACRLGAFVNRRGSANLVSVSFFGAGAAVLVGATAFLAVLGLTSWQQLAPWLMLAPIGYIFAAHHYRGRPEEQPLVLVANVATAAMLASSLASVFEGFHGVIQRKPLNLILALFFLEAAVYYALAAGLRRQAPTVYLCAATACASIWQLLSFAGASSEYHVLTFALVGLGMLIGYRIVMRMHQASGGFAGAFFQSANVLLSLSFVAGFFINLSRMAGTQVAWSIAGLGAGLTAISLLAVGLVPQRHWRYWYFLTTICQALLVLVVVQMLSTLTPWQKTEVFSVAGGFLLLVVGHIGWYRDHEWDSDSVTLSLLLGSLAAGVPLMVATLIDRAAGNFLVLNEFGFFAVSVLLLTTGVLFQLKSTTLVGGGLTALYFVTLLVMVPWSRLNMVAIAITSGGAFIFCTGLALSLYRDRLMALPGKIKAREGIFRILDWR